MDKGLNGPLKMITYNNNEYLEIIINNVLNMTMTKPIPYPLISLQGPIFRNCATPKLHEITDENNVKQNNVSEDPWIK